MITKITSKPSKKRIVFSEKKVKLKWKPIKHSKMI